MKKILKVLLYILISIIVIVFVYWLSERILSRMSAHREPSILPKEVAVYIMSNGVHTDLVVPVKTSQMEWSTLFPFQNNKGKETDYSYVGVGWGDKGFYLNTPEWKDLKASTAFVAATGIGETALHVTYHKEITESELCFKYMIDTVQYQSLIDFVKSSLEYDTENKPIVINTSAQYGDSDAFYEAKGSYSMFYSCNTWTNEALKKANMPAGIWATLDKGILSHYKK
ncbi:MULTISPECIES: TIGR02117 family protein [Sphingobacterium]|uniref:TIGR02117 family protein n=1 Tax=Sphingobacterium TaxID=28453 RepID=UPI0004E5F41A|nr:MULTISPECIES: TIGR02117 family protein [Sphingobacterium]UXD69605.1 TIGR02117 family protein [Sphingobacterium faecium]WGQ13154.1 TIGR02117 family protein [Sphingobacterium faecium]CDS91673.1 Urease-associated protein [Sphingobacterium sp. PM2-P1-29]